MEIIYASALQKKQGGLIQVYFITNVIILSLQGWNQRYFVLTRNGLSYYNQNAEHADTNRNQNGFIPGEGSSHVIPLTNALRVVVINESLFEFELSTKDRFYRFRALQKEDFDIWTRILNQVLDKNTLSVEERDEVRKKGWVLKRGKLFKTWERVYLLCGICTLFLFEEEEQCELFLTLSEEEQTSSEGKKHLLSVIPLQGASFKNIGDFEGRSYTFTVTNSNDKCYFFLGIKILVVTITILVADEDFASEWLSVIKAAIDVANGIVQFRPVCCLGCFDFILRDLYLLINALH